VLQGATTHHVSAPQRQKHLRGMPWWCSVHSAGPGSTFFTALSVPWAFFDKYLYARSVDQAPSKAQKIFHLQHTAVSDIFVGIKRRNPSSPFMLIRVVIVVGECKRQSSCAAHAAGVNYFRMGATHSLV
jgi:hypothetical protein